MNTNRRSTDWVARGDLLNNKLGQRSNAVIGAVLPQPVCHETFEGQCLLPQPEHDADEIPRMLYGAADDIISVLRGK